MEEPDAPLASADRKGPYLEMWKLEGCFCLQPAAGAATHSCITVGCKCSKKWLDQEGPGSQTWVPCVIGFHCCHEGDPAQFCRQCAAKMSLDNAIVAGRTETERASHCNDCWVS